jgi:hypothetical protein
MLLKLIVLIDLNGKSLFGKYSFERVTLGMILSELFKEDHRTRSILTTRRRKNYRTGI